MMHMLYATYTICVCLQRHMYISYKFCPPLKMNPSSATVSLFGFLIFQFKNTLKLSLFGFFIFQFKNTLTPLYLCIDKIKEQSSKNAILTPTKTLSKKQDKFPVNFQIILSSYKLDYLNKNYIYKIQTQSFFFAKKQSLIAHAKRVR